MSKLNKAASSINVMMRLLPTFPHKFIAIFFPHNDPDKKGLHLQEKNPLKRAF